MGASLMASNHKFDAHDHRYSYFSYLQLTLQQPFLYLYLGHHIFGHLFELCFLSNFISFVEAYRLRCPCNLFMNLKDLRYSQHRKER